MSDWPNPDEWNLAPLDHIISGKFLLDDCDLCERIRELEAEVERLKSENEVRVGDVWRVNTLDHEYGTLDAEVVDDHGVQHLRTEDGYFAIDPKFIFLQKFRHGGGRTLLIFGGGRESESPPETERDCGEEG